MWHTISRWLTVLAILAVSIASCYALQLARPRAPALPPSLTLAPDPTSASTALPAATATPPPEEPPVTVSGPVRFQAADGKPCMPVFAHSSERYLCPDYLSTPHNARSISGNGPARAFTAEELAAVRWMSDDVRLVYVVLQPMAVAASRGAPVRMVNVDTGQSVELGLTTDQWGIDTNQEGSIAFRTGQGVQVINPDTGRSWRANWRTEYDPPIPTPVGTIRSLEPTAFPAWLLTPPPAPLPTLPPTPSQPAFDPWRDRMYFRLSPDGQKLLLESFANYSATLVAVDQGDVDHGIVIARPSDIAKLAFDWSPDSRRVAYSLVAAQHIPELWVVNADGSSPRRLWAEDRRQGTYDYVRWSPDGQYIFFIFTPNGVDPSRAAVYQVIRASGGRPKLLFVNGMGLDLSDGGHRLVYSHTQASGSPDPEYWVAKLSY